MTKNGLAEPIVDEVAAIPLDLWAQKQGYTRLQTNLMQVSPKCCLTISGRDAAAPSLQE